jgi:hypothetical protein
MIIILSPAAVVSNNVMDEVSLALESGKNVIPVLLSECKLPFRLKRLQWVDFTGDYDSGLNQLLETLGNSPISSIKNKSESPEIKKSDETTAGEQKEKKNENLVWEKSKPENLIKSNNEIVKKSKSKKYSLITAGIVLTGLAVWAIIQFGSGNSTTNRTLVNKKPIYNQDSIIKAKNDSITAAQKATKDSIGIGRPFRGGIIFYIEPSGEHGLIAAKEDQSTAIKWGDGKAQTGATATNIGSGKTNTDKIVNWEGVGTAAQICSSRDKDGYNDWFLPSKDELNKLFNSGPMVGGFSKSDYWCSSEYSTGNAIVQNFGNGNVIKDRNKRTACHVRAVRRF